MNANASCCTADSLQARLRVFVARRVPESDVDDVLQEVFLRIQRGLPALRDDEQFGPWVFQVARHAVTDQYRARQRHPLAHGDAPERPIEEPDVDEESAEKRLAMYVAPFVAILPEPYRTALTLTELEGMTQKEAAEALGVSLSGMKSRVQRGREKLRASLEQCCAIALDARGNVIEVEPRVREG